MGLTADPGVQYDTTIYRWHTCPNTARINASNPCSEYMFLDDSACNLSSLNLTKFLDEQGNFDIEGYRHAVRVFFMAQEILVDFSAYPTQTIAQNSHDYRPLGLGSANLGTMLMLLGLPYDSDEGRAMAGALTAIRCGHAYRVSAEMAAAKGPFPGFHKNRDPMLTVDGSVYGYNIITGRKMKVFYHPEKLPINHVVVSTSPLPIVILFSNSTSEPIIYGYSINGQLIQRVR